MEYKKGDRVKHPTMDDWGLEKFSKTAMEKSLECFLSVLAKKLYP